MTAMTKAIARVGDTFPEIELPGLDGRELTAGDLRRKDPGPSAVQDAAYALGLPERELVETKPRLGGLLGSLNQGGEAVTEWQVALRLDPENLAIPE